MTKIVIMATYFGRWPVWFPAFLLSCAKNETIEWLFFTDCEVPEVNYPNIRFEPMDLGQLNNLASQKLGFPIQKLAFSQVDLQPAFGVIFDNYIKGFDFWGHCDIDVVWGNIRGFITEEILQHHDIVSCRKEFLAGHLTLWRNEPEINTLFKGVPSYRDIFSSNECFSFDEAVISTFLKALIAKANNKIRVYWPEQMVVWFHGNAKPNGWYWKSGKIFDTKHREHIYLHFQETKKLMTHIDFQTGDQPEKFWFIQHGISSRRLLIHNFLKSKFNQDHLKRSFSKFLNRSINFLRLLKKLLHIHDLYWAQKVLVNSISTRDVQYDHNNEYLFLKRLDLSISKQQYFLLESYDWALQLINKRNARFYQNNQGELFIDVAEFRIPIQNAEEIYSLKELLVNGVYNVHFSHPTVVLDIGMHTGLTSIIFASQPEVIVVGCEPCQKTFDQAIYNITLNPTLRNKIQTYRVGIGTSKYKTIAGYLPKTDNRPSLYMHQTNYGVGPKFEFEEIDIEDIANMIDTVVANYSGWHIAIKIDLGRTEYYIDGITEYSIINKLQVAGKLNLIDTIMLKWQRHNENDPDVIVSQLQDAGFRVLLFRSDNGHNGMLYALQTTTARSDCPPNSKLQHRKETSYA